MRMVVFGLAAVCGWLLTGCNTPRSASFAPGQVPTDWKVEHVAISPTPSVVQALPPEPKVAPPPAPAVTNAVPVDSFAHDTWVPLRRWAAINHLDAPVRRTTNGAVSYELSGSNGLFVVRMGNQVASWKGVSVWLGFKPQIIDDQPYVHAVDIRKSVQPLLVGGNPQVWSNPPLVVLDPGHGGVNSGTRSVLGSGMEKEYTLDWAVRTRDLLLSQGWRVALTRTNDTDIALSNRVAFAAALKADLFVSLHFNSAGTEGQHEGLETYCLTPRGMPSHVTRDYADDITAVFPNNRFDETNLRLAVDAHRALLRVNGGIDRGVRRARFLGVLRNQERAAILVEAGYLSSAREAGKVADPDYRQRLAEALAAGLTGRAIPDVVSSPVQNIATNNPPEPSPPAKEEAADAL
jgi:N-acetylmuramoyl-L-alanine amidase